MENNTRLYSLSGSLSTLNENLSSDIVLIKAEQLKAIIESEDSAEIIFEWNKINYIKKSINLSRSKNTRFICIDTQFSPENRLYLLNNNIEYLTLEKFSKTSINDYMDWSRHEKYKVLIVKDDIVQALIYETILNNAGILVKTIHTNIDIIDAIGYFEPDLLLVDLKSDEIATKQIIKTIKSKTDNLILPIVFLTKISSEKTKKNILEMGATDVLTKPVSPELLISSLLNRMQGKFFQEKQAINTIEKPKTCYHKIFDFENETLHPSSR